MLHFWGHKVVAPEKMPSEDRQEKLWQKLREAAILSNEYLETYRSYYEEYLVATETEKGILYQKLVSAHDAWTRQLTYYVCLREQYSNGGDDNAG